MISVAVIIPYYQREKGILRRALESVLSQRLADGVMVDVVVVDDGSPVPAQSEVEGLVFAPPFHLTLITQTNAGVGAARNSGLKAIHDTTKYIAFLDSDDSWHEGHLDQALEALESGRDFYFCDNRREGHYDSHFAGTPAIQPFIKTQDIIPISKDDVIALVLQDFPCLLPTVVYRRAAAPELLFETSLRNAGEDTVFFMQLLSGVRECCFSAKIMVDCGPGINIYFGNLGWDSAGNLPRIIDRLKSHVMIKNTIPLSRKHKILNDILIVRLRRNVAFHALRCLIKSGRWPQEMQVMASEDRWFYAWFMFYGFEVAVGWALGVYHPA